MITEDYVSFETAKLLKEKGFDENTPVNYFVGDDKPRGCVAGEMIYHKKSKSDTHLIACPTLQMAMKWLREVHHLFILVEFSTFEFNKKRPFMWSIRYQKVDGDYIGGTYHPTYEEACETAIKYCLENLT